MKRFEELISFKLIEALAKDKPKSTEKSESKTAGNLEMEPKQREQTTKSTAKVAEAIPMPWISTTNMDDNHNNTNTPPTPSTTNADKINDRDGVKASKKRGRPSSKSKEKSTPLAEEILSPQQKKPSIEVSKGMEQFDTPHAMFYPPPFGHPYPYPPCSSGHLPMPIYQENEIQTVIIKDNKQEISADAKDDNGVYRNCLVCGDNNKKCGKHTGTGLQICNGCQLFFKRVVESDADKKASFECSQGQESANCLIRKETRKSCEFCRFQTCLKAGMDRQKIVELKAKHENSEDAKDGNGLYRNCLVCGDNNKKCGKYTGTGLQICNGCQEFFKRVVKTEADTKATFQCSQGSENCLISKDTRNSCEFCRFQTCLKAGMDPHKTVELKAKREREKQKGSAGNGN